MSYLVANPEDRFSRDEAHFSLYTKSMNEKLKINPHLPSGLLPHQLDKSISNFRDVWCTFSFLFYFE